MSDYVRIYPAFPLNNNDRAQTLFRDLGIIVFPHGNSDAALTPNETSDLRHIVTAIQQNLAGFITNDQAILAAANTIRSKYGIEVTSPAAFQASDDRTQTVVDFEIPAATPLSLLAITASDAPTVHHLLSKVGLSGSAIAGGWISPTDGPYPAFRRGIWNGSSLIGYLAISPEAAPGATIARVAVDETDAQALHGARILLLHLVEQIGHKGPRTVQLEFPTQQSLVHEVASAFGFRGNGNPSKKILLGRVASTHNWSGYRDELLRSTGIKLPTSAPLYSGTDPQIEMLTPNGNKIHLALEAVESLLAPALLCLPGRPAVITPVRRSFAEPLLGHSPQGSLLPRAPLSLFKERHYISGPHTYKALQRGTLMLMYESTREGGSGALVAIARVRNSYLKPTNALSATDFTASVLDTKNIGTIGSAKLKTVTAFDNLFCLPCPVPLHFLRNLGCGRSNDLITTRRITDAHLQSILRAAFP